MKLSVLFLSLAYLLTPLRADDGLITSITQKFGKPDVDASTVYDNPRPRVVTRWLVYKKQSVEFLLYPDGGPSDAPPYKRWKLLGTVDPRTKQPISADEVLRRMGGK